MSTIEELLTTPQVDEEVWELDNRYEVNLAYSDDQGPVEVVGKNIGSMSNQISIQGESMSQYLEFMMPRYYDNIDLSDKTITIHYEMNGAGGEITPINMYRSQDKIKFGWVIPATASQTFGNLSIGIWARGYVNAEEYIWKSRTASYTIEKGLMIGGGIPEPDENWYLEFVRQMDVKVSEASLYASRAKQSEGSASSSESAARGFMEEARTGASTAIQKAGEALNSASTASNASITAQESATLAMEYRDGAEEYYERTKGISEGLSGRLVPMGTVTFENLPALEDAVSGWMYNISNEFTTTSQFKEGAGKVIPLGSNVFKTTDGYWDVLAGSPVSGVKGSAEATYRSGNVNITPANLGITVVNNTKDENKNVNHSKTSDSTTKAAQDSNGNVIVDTYASKSEASLSGTATGKNPTAQDSTNAPFIYGKFKGYTLQDGEPTPDNPIEINGLAKDGAIEVKTTGNNLLDTSGLVKVEKNGVVYTPVYKDGLLQYINCNDTNTSAEALFSLYLQTNSLPDTLEKGVEYIASVNSTGNVNIQIYEYINGAWSNILTTKTSKSFIISENATGLLVRLQVLTQGTSVSNVKCYPMIRKAEITDNTYEPYTETTAAIPTDAPHYEGDYIEVYADGSGKEYRKMKEVVFDGSDDENFLLSNAYTNENRTGYYIELSDAKHVYDGAESASDYFTKITCTIAKNDVTKTGFLVGDTVYNPNRPFCLFILPSSIVTDLATFKTWLQSNPVTVVYELAEPTETPLTAEQVAEFKKLYTFEPVTNVLCDGEVEMLYFRNNPNGRVAGMLQRQIDSITSALSSTEEVSDEYRNNLS